MESKRLYCVRHGHSEENETKIFSAGKASLTQKGVSQARKVATRFSGLSIDFVHSSPYMRALETAKHITKIKNMGNPSIVDFTYEYAYLSPEHEGLSAYSPEYEKIHRQVYGYWQGNTGTLPSHSESFDDFLMRIDRFMTHYEDLDFVSGVFVGHALFFKVLKARVLLKETLDSKTAYNIRENTKLSNTGIIVYEISDKGWKLLRWNDDEHLTF